VSAITQFAKRAIAGKPAISGWLYQPYADYQFRKRQSYLSSRYRQLLQDDSRSRREPPSP